MKMATLVNRNYIAANLRSTTKEEVIAEIVDHIARFKKFKNKKTVLDCLLERERKGTTGIGGGAAIPHARLDDLDDVIFFAGVSKKGIDFGAVDGRPVYLIFLFLTPLAETGTHLKILSRISALLKNRYLVEEMMRAETDDELYELLKIEETEKSGFLSLSKAEIYQELDTSDQGLTDEGARVRLMEYGRNELKKIRKTSLLRRFIENFINVLALLMWVGAGLAFLSGMPEIGWAIIAVIVINAIFSFWQEFKAEKALDALKNLIPNYVRVVRNGAEKKIISSEVVPGDIVIFEEGDSVPADARLIEAQELRVDNSVFSGESRPGYKIAEPVRPESNPIWTEVPNLIFAGTSVVAGTAKAVVTATGMSTEIGKIAYLTQTVKIELSPLQKEIARLTRVIALIAVVMGLVFLLVGKLVAGLSLAGAAVFAIGIILGNVPEGLMPTVTLSLAMAVQRMARRHALIKKLSSVETLGCTNVICTDKTGTLTTNQISVRRIWINGKLIEVTGTSYEPKGEFIHRGKIMPPETFADNQLPLLLEAGALCNTAKLLAPSETQKFWTVIGDPTEGALLVLAAKAGVDVEGVRRTCPYIKRFPFESIRKRMSTVNKVEGGRIRGFVKGSPKEVLELSRTVLIDGKVIDLAPDMRQQIMRHIDDFANGGLRVLAVAYRDFSPEDAEQATVEKAESDLTFIGLTAMSDPPRPEVRDALTLCKEAGIRVVMITGDYGLTALSVARQVGIVSSPDARVITGTELNEMTEQELAETLENEVVFARVNPEHKLRVVSMFKERGDIVAVTGDGVNDAPALKRADIGVAMGLRGTDVAKESAEMILTDDNFASIVAAIEEGRAVFDNIKKFITYIFAHLVPEAVPFILYVIFRLPVPITALQILAIDLGTETLPALALGVEKPEAGIMHVPPRPRSKGLIDKTVLFRGYVFLGLLNTVAVLVAYFFVLYTGGWRPGMSLEPNEITFLNPLHLKATTMVFGGIVVMQIANIFACRSERQSAIKLGFFTNPLILWGIAFELVFLVALVYLPPLQRLFNTIGLSPLEWLILLVFMVIIFFAEEVRKRLKYGANAVHGYMHTDREE